MLEKSLQSPLDCKIKPVNPKGNQPWIFIGRTIAEAEAPIFWSPEAKSQLIGKDPDSGKDWRQKKGAAEDKMVSSITNSMDMNLSKLQGIVEDRRAWHATVHGVTKSQTRLATEQQWLGTVTREVDHRWQTKTCILENPEDYNGPDSLFCPKILVGR